MTAQVFIVRGKVLGARPVQSHYRTVEGFSIRPSYAYFCPKCSEIWGKVIVDHFASYHNVVARRCPYHAESGTDGSLAGSPYWLEDPTAFDADWPPEAIKHEFHNALQKALKEIEHESGQHQSGYSTLVGWTEGPPGRPLGHREVLLDGDTC
jgi:hypothetical protein